jgi:hypothetical protein
MMRLPVPKHQERRVTVSEPSQCYSPLAQKSGSYRWRNIALSLVIRQGHRISGLVVQWAVINSNESAASPVPIAFLALAATLVSIALVFKILHVLRTRRS